MATATAGCAGARRTARFRSAAEAGVPTRIRSAASRSVIPTAMSQ